MFNPPILKFKKLKKGTFKNKEFNLNTTSLKFGDFGLKTLYKGTITYPQIESARRIIAKNIKGIGKLWIRGLPKTPKTLKPLEFRMGKGKGNINHWVWNVSAGTVIFEVSFLRNKANATEFLLKASKKLPIKSKIIIR